jgi:carbonic anhydrase
MKFLTLGLLFLASCASTSWNHQKSVSPYTWGSLSDRYRSCDEGRHQSPINLDHRRAKESDEKIEFNYRNTAANFHNNGYTLDPLQKIKDHQLFYTRR